MDDFKLSVLVEVVTAENWPVLPLPLDELLWRFTEYPPRLLPPPLESGDGEEKLSVIETDVPLASDMLVPIPYVAPEDVDWPNAALLAFPGGAYKTEMSKKSG